MSYWSHRAHPQHDARGEVTAFLRRLMCLRVLLSAYEKEVRHVGARPVIAHSVGEASGWIRKTDLFEDATVRWLRERESKIRAPVGGTCRHLTGGTARPSFLVGLVGAVYWVM